LSRPGNERALAINGNGGTYLWVQCGGPPDQPILLYDYDPSRSQRVPIRLLEGFEGYLLTDGYEAFRGSAPRTA